MKDVRRQLQDEVFREVIHPITEKRYIVGPTTFMTERVQLVHSFVRVVADSNPTAPIPMSLPPLPPLQNQNHLYSPFDNYDGHNIAAIAVNAVSGLVLGVAFNQCVLNRSTAAHAEERLIDRLFATSDLLDLDAKKYNKLLHDVVVYSTLQPCYQCAGKLIMAGVKQVIWLQDDPLIKVDIFAEVEQRDGETWRTRGCSAASLFAECEPLAASLDRGYERFYAAADPAKKKEDRRPFYVRYDDNGKAVQTECSSSVPTFLCTDAARVAYERAADAFHRVADSATTAKCVPSTRAAVARNASDTSSLRAVTADGAALTHIANEPEAYLYLRAVLAYVKSDAYGRGRHT